VGKDLIRHHKEAPLRRTREGAFEPLQADFDVYPIAVLFGYGWGRSRNRRHARYNTRWDCPCVVACRAWLNETQQTG
jgi:hypothetical protein